MSESRAFTIGANGNKTGKVCAKCQYFRETPPHFEAAFGISNRNYCSNTNSPLNMCGVFENETCSHFSERGKKAPLWMRLANKVMAWIIERLQK